VIKFVNSQFFNQPISAPLNTRVFKSRPVEGHSGAQETIIAGPYHNLIRQAPRSRLRRRREGGNVGRVSPHHRLGVWGSVVSSLSGSGAEPGRKRILCIFQVRKPSGTPISVFLSDGGAPKRRGARENFPLSTGLFKSGTQFICEFCSHICRICKCNL